MHQLYGHYLMNTSSAEEFYSPWFSTRTDRVCFGAECLRIAGSDTPKLEVTFETKNLEDAASAATTLMDGTVPYRIELTDADNEPVLEEVQGCLEQVRFKYTVSGTNACINFRMLPPSPIPN